jgi:type IV secretion system protein VirB10
MTNETHQPGGSSCEERVDANSTLDGEPGIPSVVQESRNTVSWKGMFAVALMVFSLVAVTAAALNRALSGHNKEEAEAKHMGERPMSASNEPRRLSMTLPAAGSTSSAAKPVPAIVPIPEDSEAAPIGVRRTGPALSVQGSPQRIPPEDAPVLLVSSRPGSNTSTIPGGNRLNVRTVEEINSAQDDPLQATRRNLEGYQRQLQGLLETLSRHAAGSEAQVTPEMPVVAPVSPSRSTADAVGLFGGQLQGSATPHVTADRFHSRSLTLPKGTFFTCALRTRIISATSGMVGCQVQRNVYGDDGRVLLIERGSQVDGEYRIASVRPGAVRIPVLWTRVRTPNGVTVDIESPASGSLGEAGIEGFVDNRWVERVGAAMLLSLIDDAVKLTIQNQANDRQADTVVLSSTTSNTSKLAEKVLDTTINIPPLIYQNQGGIVGVYVARDVDFSRVYELKAVPQ